MKWVVMVASLGGLALLAWFFLFRSKGGATSDPDPRKKGRGTDEDANRHWLVAVSGVVKGKTFHVGARNVTIGRGTNCFVQLKDKESSRVHCQIRHTPKGLQLTDMSSSNGTQVNGKQIQIHLLQDGDRIQVGDATVIYRLEGDFEQDAGVSAKAVGKTQFEATAYSEGGAGHDFKEVAMDTVRSCGGDIGAAAKKLKMDEATLRKVLG